MYHLKIFTLFLFILPCLTLSAFLNGNESACLKRCNRLLVRTLERINYTPRKIEILLKSNQRINNLSDICWKVYDFNDCQRQCGQRSKRSLTDFEELSKTLIKRCKFVDQESSHNIQCIHKYHSFMEVRCSSFLSEAVKLKNKVTEKEDMQTHETCRFLHYHHTCLANTVFIYCPSAKIHFNKFTLPNYFLSFIIPDNDELFTDEFFDYCQVFDFAKRAKDVHDTTSSLKREVFYDGTTQMVKAFTEVPIVRVLDLCDDQKKNDKAKKSISSTESLEDTPPRIETTTHHNFDRTTLKVLHDDNLTTPSTSRSWNAEPININLVLNPVSDKNSTMPDGGQGHEFTINPNDLVSTIFRIPNIFPTNFVSPIPMTEAEVDVQTEVSIDGLEDDHTIKWKDKKSIEMDKKNNSVVQKVESASEKNNDLNAVNLLDNDPKKTQLTSPTSGEMFYSNLTSLEVENTTDTVVDSFNIGLNASPETVNISWSTETSNHKKSDNELVEKPVQFNKNIIKKLKNSSVNLNSYETANKSHEIANAVIHVDPLVAEESNQTELLFHDTEAHVKGIRHYRKPGDSKGDNIKKENSGVVYFSNAQAKATLQYQTFFATTISAMTPPKIENVRSSTLNKIPEYDPEEINWKTLKSIKWFIVGYGLLIVTTLCIVIYLILSLILKKCQKQRPKPPPYAYQC